MAVKKSRSDQYAKRHEYAAGHMYKRYGNGEYLTSKVQRGVIYSAGSNQVMVLYSGDDGDSFQGLTAANYDDLARHDVILYRDEKTDTTVEFYKGELQQFLDYQFLHWRSDNNGNGGTVTRMLVRVKSVDGVSRLVITSSGRPELHFDIAKLSGRGLMAGSAYEGNALLGALVAELPKKRLTRPTKSV
jgi:hypothetical protein